LSTIGQGPLRFGTQDQETKIPAIRVIAKLRPRRLEFRTFHKDIQAQEAPHQHLDLSNDLRDRGFGEIGIPADGAAIGTS
jgi:hypothetical protein